ncbi:putative nucleotidyltransferase, ribonuclease H [Tanacetum coccineum]
MEEMVYKFINEGKQEHEEMRAFIREFRTSNQLLFKEKNNSLSELRFEVHGLSKVIDNTLISNSEVKGVTTRGGKMTTREQVVQPSVEIHIPSIPFLRMLRKEKEEAQQRKFLENMKQLHINLPFIEALAQMPKYARFLKGLLTNKARVEEAYTVMMNERCSSVLLNKLPSKEKYPGSFTIPCDIGHLHINNALVDLGASISLMPYMMYEKLGLGEPKPTRMSLELADRSIQYPRGIIKNVLIKVDKFFFPINFVILDMPEDSRVPIILGRPFLETTRAMIHVFNKKITLRVGDDEVIFNVDQSIKRPPTEDDECYDIDDLDNTINIETQELLGRNESDDNSDIEMPIRRIDSVNTPYSEAQKTAGTDGEKRKEAITWKMSDIKGISPSFCTHKILMKDDFKPVIQPQRRLNPKVQDVVKNEIVELLDSGLIYPISDSSWVSPIHVVLKKGGMTIVLNDNNELIPSRTVTGWRVCIDYRKLNDATRKDHFSLPFIDQMLERLYGNEYYCFLDGFSGFFQIPIAPEDQEKTTFTCPYGTFAYKRMPFGLCNAPATFQRCMTAIFHGMVEDFMEVFMDDFFVFGNSFNYCLANLDKILARCEETNLVLNWKKCHFMVKEGQQIDGKFKPIYYASKTLNNAQEHYTTTEKELLAVVFFFDKFRPYLILSKTVVYTDHSALKAENLAADHLSRLENPDLGVFIEAKITDEFPDKQLMILKAKLNDDEPWYADYVNYIVGKIVPPKWTPERRSEILEILAHCHSGPTRGHHIASITGRKVYESGFLWPSISLRMLKVT